MLFTVSDRNHSTADRETLSQPRRSTDLSAQLKLTGKMLLYLRRDGYFLVVSRVVSRLFRTFILSSL